MTYKRNAVGAYIVSAAFLFLVYPDGAGNKLLKNGDLYDQNYTV